MGDVASGLTSDDAILGRAVEYDLSEIERNLTTLLAAIDTWMSQEPARNVLGSYAGNLVNNCARQIRARLSDDLRIVVIGAFKRGKSSLINAMARAPVTAVDITPETTAITTIRYGDANAAAVCLKDGGRVPLQPHECVRECLAPILARLGDRVSHVEVCAPCEDLRSLVWIDTPGTGDIFASFDSTVASYLAEADVVVLVVSPLAPLSQSEVDFHRQALAPHDFPKIFIVLNMLDLVRPVANQERIIAHVRGKVSTLFPGADFAALSTADELARQAGAPRPMPEAADHFAAEFDRFRTTIGEAARVHCSAVQSSRGLSLCGQLIDNLAMRAAVVRSGLAADRSRLDAAVEAQQQELTSLDEEDKRAQTQLTELVENLKAESHVWLKAFIGRLVGNLKGQIRMTEAEKLHRHLPFFIADVLRQALAACVESHLPRLRDAALADTDPATEAFTQLFEPSQLNRTTAGAVFRAPSLELLQLIEDYADRLFIGGGMLVDTIRKATDGGSEQRAFQDLLDAKHAYLVAAVVELADRSYETLCRDIANRLKTARADKLAAIGDGLRQAQTLREKDTSATADREQQLVLFDKQLGEFRGEVEQLRGKLGGAEII